MATAKKTGKSSAPKSKSKGAAVPPATGAASPKSTKAKPKGSNAMGLKKKPAGRAS